MRLVALGSLAMDQSETEQFAPVEGQRIPESLGRIWALIGACILIAFAGAALTWAWWTEFPLYVTEEVRAVTPEDQWRARKPRMIGGREGFELPAAPRHPVPVKTTHVFGFTYGVLGIVIVVAGSAAMLAGLVRLIHSSIQRPTLIIGENCLQLVVRDHVVKIHIPYTNISELGFMKSDSGKPLCVGVNLRDPHDPAMYYHDAARSKKRTGWDYAVGNKEIFAVPTAQIYEHLQLAVQRGQ